MAANRRKPYPQVARDRINTGILLNRLQDHVVGKAEMSSTQVQAAKVLLNKTLPDLQAVQHSGPNEGPIPVVNGTPAEFKKVAEEVAAKV